MIAPPRPHPGSFRDHAPMGSNPIVMTKRTLLVALLLGSVLAVAACETEPAGPLGLQTNSKVFDEALFRQNLESSLNGALGYALVITRSGQAAESAASGIAAIDAASGDTVTQSVGHDINIASVTKAFTAMATISLLDERDGVDLDSTIDAWLPDGWLQHADVRSLTFRELLIHTSGIRTATTTWDSLRAVVASPTVQPPSYSYANANFGLFRALLPKLDDQEAFDSQEAVSAPDDFDRWMSRKYVEIMNERVFGPAGVTNATCDVDPGKVTTQALNEINNPPLNPQGFGDWTERCGGGGFYLSVSEMARVMAYLVHTQNILSIAQRNTMDQGQLGWDPNDVFATNYGMAYGKDGALFRDGDGDGGLSAGDSGLQTWVGKFPNQVELAMAVNSVGTNWRPLAQIARAAYEGAWVEP